MEHSFMHVLRTGNDFMRKHTQVFWGFCVLYGFSFGGYLVLKALYAYINGDAEVYSALVRAFAAGDTETSQELLQSVSYMGTSFADKAYSMFVADTFLVVLTICLVTYLLSALRNREMSVSKALRSGLNTALKAWMVIAVLQVLKFAWLYKADVYEALQMESSLVMNVINTGVALAFFVAVYFLYQVIVDGATNFMTAVRASWKVMRTQWTSVILATLVVMMLALLIALMLVLVGAILSHFFAVQDLSVARIVGALSGVIALVFISYAFSIYVNKIYLNSK